jgi:quinol monooxygenase YgiN
MPKHTNVVRFRVKSGKQAEFESLFNKADNWDGQLIHILARTDEESYVGYGLWESEERMKNAMPQMIALLDSARHLLEELSPELGVTDPVSGTVVFEKQI